MASTAVGAALVGIGLAAGAGGATAASPETSTAAGVSVPHAPAAGAGLRPMNQRTLQAIVRTTARELDLPGALVRLRTPQGEFTATYGTTRLGARIRP